MLKKLSLLFFMVLFVLSQDACFSQATKHAGYAEGEALIIFKKHVSRAEAESIHKRLGSKILRHMKIINGDHVKIREGLTVEEAIQAYQAESSVEYAEPNWRRTIQTEGISNDSGE
jgi:hypothetical protein